MNNEQRMEKVDDDRIAHAFCVVNGKARTSRGLCKITGPDSATALGSKSASETGLAEGDCFVTQNVPRNDEFTLAMKCSVSMGLAEAVIVLIGCE